VARPKTDENNKLSQVILVRVTHGQMTQLETASEACGQSIGELSRAKIFKGRFPQPVLPKTDQQTVMELNKIGNNLNQLTRKVNSGLLPQGLLALLMKLMQLLELIQTKLMIHDRQSKNRGKL
jgi:hypothetical protein